MNERTSGKSAALHAAHCGIWDLPDTGEVEAILGAGYEDEAVANYLAAARPVYDTLARVLAQLAGLFLLQATTKSSGLSLDHAMFAVARDQLGEAVERARALVAPAAAQCHKDGLIDLGTRLAEAIRGMDNLSVVIGEELRTHRTREVLNTLHAAQRLLIACAEPDARITPVDFSHACCTCGGLVPG